MEQRDRQKTADPGTEQTPEHFTSDPVTIAYIQGVLTEWEKKIYKRTVNKVEVITRSMTNQEKEAYFQSRSFANALNQTRKKDKEYRQLAAGELDSYHRTALSRLRPLIQQELRNNRPVDLAFLQSVQRQHLNLKTAHLAEDILQNNRPAQYLIENQ